MNTNDTPLIFTKNGNMPVASLRMEVSWEDKPEYVKFVEKYFDKETGELVKEGAHVLMRTGFNPASIQQGALA